MVLRCCIWGTACILWGLEAEAAWSRPSRVLIRFVDANICRVVGAGEEVGGSSVVKRCNAQADPIVCFVGLTACGLTKPC